MLVCPGVFQGKVQYNKCNETGYNSTYNNRHSMNACECCMKAHKAGRKCDADGDHYAVEELNGTLQIVNLRELQRDAYRESQERQKANNMPRPVEAWLIWNLDDEIEGRAGDTSSKTVTRKIYTGMSKAQFKKNYNNAIEAELNASATIGKGFFNFSSNLNTKYSSELS